MISDKSKLLKVATKVGNDQLNKVPSKYGIPGALDGTVDSFLDNEMLTEELGDVIDYNLNNNLRPSGRAPAMDIQTLEQLRQGMLKDRAQYDKLLQSGKIRDAKKRDAMIELVVQLDYKLDDLD